MYIKPYRVQVVPTLIQNLVHFYLKLDYTISSTDILKGITQAKKDIAWGKQSRVVLDVGCGVASFGGYLFDRDVLTMSFAPKDEHEAQVQFALERGIPAISAVMGTKRLPFPSRVFDVIHCARCRVPWHIEGDFFCYNLQEEKHLGAKYCTFSVAVV